MSTSMTGPMEIAIRVVKPGQEAEFVAARAAFIRSIKAEAGVERDWEFQSFFAMPAPDDREVFIGMTRYDSVETVGRISDKLLAGSDAQAFFSTFDMRAFVLTTPADGQPFHLKDFVQRHDQVLEVAVRKPKAGMENQFQPRRDAFFDRVAKQPGYIMDRELIDLQSGAKVVLIAWESVQDFQNALSVLQTQPEMSDFFEILDVVAYQATQPVTSM